MKRITLGLGAALMLLFCADLSAQTAAPYAISPRWVFGNKAYLNFTAGTTPSQPSRSDDIIANEGSSTLCDSLKNLTVYSNNVRLAGSNFSPLTNYMASSSSSTQGGVIFPDPSNPYASFFVATGNAESEYTGFETKDVPKQGLKLYKSSKSGTTTVTSPSLARTLTSADDKSLEQLVVGSDGNYGYWVVYQVGTMYASGDPNFNAVRVTNTGVSTTAAVNTNYSTNGNWNFAVQGTIKLNRCQTKIAIVQSTKIAVFEWDRTTGRIGNLIKYITGVNVGGGSKLYGCEFSANGNYLYASSLGGSELVVVDLLAAGTDTGLSYKANQTASGTLQIGPNDVIYVSNGTDSGNSTSLGTITNADNGGTYNPAGLALGNGSTARLGLANQPWLNPRAPKITTASTKCGTYTFTNTFLTYFKDAIKIDKAVWDLDDGTTITNTGANVYNSVTKTYSSGGNKDITVTVTDNICKQEWVGKFTQNIPCTLPIKLISFEGSSNHGTVNLNWATSLEINNSRFEIQRSTDGKTFETIGSVEGNKNSASVSNYIFTDNNPEDEVNYYRLVQFDLDGTSTISAVTSVSLNELEIKAYPNPTEGDFNVAIPSAEEATLLVTDVLGKEVFKTTLNGGATIVAFGKELVKGTYILRYINSTESKSLKLEKK